MTVRINGIAGPAYKESAFQWNDSLLCVSEAGIKIGVYSGTFA